MLYVLKHQNGISHLMQVKELIYYSSEKYFDLLIENGSNFTVSENEKFFEDSEDVKTSSDRLMFLTSAFVDTGAGVVIEINSNGDKTLINFESDFFLKEDEEET